MIVNVTFWYNLLEGILAANFFFMVSPPIIAIVSLFHGIKTKEDRLILIEHYICMHINTDRL